MRRPNSRVAEENSMERALAFLILAVVAPSVAHAEDGNDCRHLLTIDEVASAVGGAAELTSASKRGEVGTGFAESSRLQVCSWASSSLLGGGVNIDVVPSVEPAGISHALDVVQFPLDEKREQHWTEQRQDFGGVRCSSLSPPQPSTAQTQVTGCVGEVNGAALYVGVASRMGRPTFDLVKRLFDQAGARL
jgi:hypothetical protein